MFYPIHQLKAISLENVHQFMSSQKIEDYQTKSGKSLYFFPSMPSCWLFFAQQDDDESHLCDGYDWSKPKPAKTISLDYQSMTELTVIAYTLNGVPKELKQLFQRKIWLSRKPIRKNDAILIVYQGDFQIWMDNRNKLMNCSKKRSSQEQTSPQKKACKENVEAAEKPLNDSNQQVDSDDDNNRSVQAKQTQSIASNLPPRKNSNRFKPINQKLGLPPLNVSNQQKKLKNMKYAFKQYLDTLRCSQSYEIHSLIYLSHGQLKGCANLIDYNDGMIVAGLVSKGALDFFTAFKLQFEDKMISTDLLHLDYAYDLGHFYLTTLLVKNCWFEEGAVLPLLYVLHNQEFPENRRAIIEWIITTIDLQESSKIIIYHNGYGFTDDIGIFFYGYEDLLEEVERYCDEHNLENSSSYLNHMAQLKKSKTLLEFFSNMKMFYKIWDSGFVEFFEEEIKESLLAILNNDPFLMTLPDFEDNSAELFRTSFEHFYEFQTPVELDELLLKLYNFQIICFEHFNQDVMNQHRVKQEYRGLVPLVSEDLKLLPDEVLEEVRKAIFLTKAQNKGNQKDDLLRFVLRKNAFKKEFL